MSSKKDPIFQKTLEYLMWVYRFEYGEDFPELSFNAKRQKFLTPP